MSDINIDEDAIWEPEAGWHAKTFLIMTGLAVSLVLTQPHTFLLAFY